MWNNSPRFIERKSQALNSRINWRPVAALAVGRRPNRVAGQALVVLPVRFEEDAPLLNQRESSVVTFDKELRIRPPKYENLLDSSLATVATQHEELSLVLCQTYIDYVSMDIRS
jgi:hypothetical protein